MKTIIAGSRSIKDYNILLDAISKINWIISEVISGTSQGVDKLGERYAKERNIVCRQFPANWNIYGKSAGYIRNTEMANNAEALLAIWDGSSKGTGHMIKTAQDKELKIYIYRIIDI